MATRSWTSPCVRSRDCAASSQPPPQSTLQGPYCGPDQREPLMPKYAARAMPVLAFLALVGLASPGLRAADIYDAAVAHVGRPPSDLKRDALDHPAEVMRLAGIKP